MTQKCSELTLKRGNAVFYRYENRLTVTSQIQKQKQPPEQTAVEQQGGHRVTFTRKSVEEKHSDESKDGFVRLLLLDLLFWSVKLVVVSGD